MAEGGRPGGGGDNGNPLTQISRSSNKQLTRQDVGNQARFLMNTFINGRLHSDQISDSVRVDDLTEPGTPTGPPISQMSDVARALRCIGDELDQDTRLQSMIDQISPDASKDVFTNIAKEIFSDGVFNWGRVVALFYFAFKMVIKAVDRLPVMRSVIDFVVRFIVDHVAPWIIERGGWEAIQEYFGATTIQTIGVFVLGVVSSAMFIWWKTR